jgi:hypothetical protein
MFFPPKILRVGEYIDAEGQGTVEGFTVLHPAATRTVIFTSCRWPAHPHHQSSHWTTGSSTLLRHQHHASSCCARCGEENRPRHERPQFQKELIQPPRYKDVDIMDASLIVRQFTARRRTRMIQRLSIRRMFDSCPLGIEFAKPPYVASGLAD